MGNFARLDRKWSFLNKLLNIKNALMSNEKVSIIYKRPQNHLTKKLSIAQLCAYLNWQNYTQILSINTENIYFNLKTGYSKVSCITKAKETKSASALKKKLRVVSC